MSFQSSRRPNNIMICAGAYRKIFNARGALAAVNQLLADVGTDEYLAYGRDEKGRFYAHFNGAVRAETRLVDMSKALYAFSGTSADAAIAAVFEQLVSPKDVLPACAPKTVSLAIGGQLWKPRTRVTFI